MMIWTGVLMTGSAKKAPWMKGNSGHARCGKGATNWEVHHMSFTSSSSSILYSSYSFSSSNMGWNEQDKQLIGRIKELVWFNLGSCQGWDESKGGWENHLPWFCCLCTSLKTPPRPYCLQLQPETEEEGFIRLSELMSVITADQVSLKPTTSMAIFPS